MTSCTCLTARAKRRQKRPRRPSSKRSAAFWFFIHNPNSGRAHARGRQSRDPVINQASEHGVRPSILSSPGKLVQWTGRLRQLRGHLLKVCALKHSRFFDVCPKEETLPLDAQVEFSRQVTEQIGY